MDLDLLQNQLSPSNSLASAPSFDLMYQLIWIMGFVVIAIVLIFVILLILKKVFSSHKIYPAIFEKKIFMLTVPSMMDADEEKEKQNKQIKDVIGSVENFYSAVGGIPAQKGFKTWLFGRFDSWSFEVVVGGDGLITFYMAIPVYLEQYIKQQLLSQYPHCQIEEVEDYNIFGQQGFASAGYLRLSKANMFPLLTFKQMENDPLLGILSTLSKLGPGQSAAIQFVMRSAPSGWRKKGVKIASSMQQGKNLKQAMAVDNPLVNALGKPSDWIGTSKSAQSPKDPYRLSPLEEQMIKSIEEKASKTGFDVNVRIIAFAPIESQAKEILKFVANAFSQYSNYQYGNNFKAIIKGSGQKLITDFI
ncbi:MAG: hypothetical protein WCV92_01860, partial [Candidatus Buchananbacteria bacterium]